MSQDTISCRWNQSFLVQCYNRLLCERALTISLKVSVRCTLARSTIFVDDDSK